MKTGIFHLVFFLSGIAGLGYQMVWVRVFSLGTGNEIAAVLAVITAFFGGLSLGAWSLDKTINRSSRPGYWYAALEFLIGAWGFLSIFLLPVVNRWVLHLMGIDSSWLRHWGLCFVIPLAVLLPATAAMGATLPAMERLVAPLTVNRRCVGGLYGVNTLGAMAGTLVVVYVLVPHWGYTASLLSLAVVNIICALAAVGLFHNAARPASERKPGTLSAKGAGRLFLTLFATGFFGIGYEVVCTRALSQILENTVYTYAGLIIVYLFGTGLGAAAYQKFPGGKPFEKTLSVLLCGICFSCLAGLLLLPAAGAVYIKVLYLLGRGRAAMMVAEMLPAAMLFLGPTLFMGAAFSHLAQTAGSRSFGVGRSLALNTLGGALAPLVCGVFLLPAIGVQWSLVLLSLSYCLLIPRPKVIMSALALTSAPICVMIVMPWQPVELPPDSELSAYQEGVTASVAVITSAEGDRSLSVNNHFYMGSTAAAMGERRKVHVPLLLHADPRSLLYLGVGTGVSFGAVTAYDNVTADGVELVPEVMGLMPRFAPENCSPYAAGISLYTADARRFVRAVKRKYDVVVADLFHPARDGAGALYTLEHFRAVRDRLSEGGLFCQWLPLLQMDMPVLRIIVRTFLEVFPHTRAYVGTFSIDSPGLALVGGSAPRYYRAGWLAGRVKDQKLKVTLEQEGLPGTFKLFAHFFADENDLSRFADHAPINLDNHPIVMYKTPGFSKSKAYTTYGRLQEMLTMFKRDPSRLVGDSDGRAGKVFVDTLAMVLAARDRYLVGAIAEKQGEMGAALQAYLESVRLSGIFLTGYAVCIRKAIEEHKKNPAAARRLLLELIRLRPEIPDAGIVLEDLF